MDKKDVYYIQIKGTNDRIHTKNDGALKVTGQFIEEHLTMLFNASGMCNLHKISVEEYERTFGVDN